LALTGCATNTIIDERGNELKFTTKGLAQYLRAKALEKYGREAIAANERIRVQQMATVECPMPRLDNVDREVATMAVFANMACQSRMDYGELAQVVSAASGNPLDPGAQMAVSENNVRIAETNADARTKAAWLGVLGGFLPAALYAYRDIELSKDQIPGQAIIMGDGSSFNVQGSNSGTQGGGAGAMAFSEGGPAGNNDQVRQMGISVFGDTGQNYGWATDSARVAPTTYGPSMLNDTSGTQSAITDQAAVADTITTDSNIYDGSQAPAVNQSGQPVQATTNINGN
jgi:hypothetical protein